MVHLKETLKSTCSFTLILMVMACHAQVADFSVMKSDSGEYVRNMERYIGVKLGLFDDIENFHVNSAGQKYDIRPNSRMALGMNLHFWRVGLTISIPPSFLPGNNDDELKGRTKSFGLATNIYLGHWFQYLAYGRVKGYYLHNTGDYIPNWIKGTDSYILFPELVLNEFRGQTSYKFNPRFSLKAIRAQTERQLKSAGSFIPMLLYRYYIVDDRTELTGSNSSQKSNNLETLIAAGYYYTWVIRQKFYISCAAIPGAGMINTWLLTRMPQEELKTHETNFIFRAEGLLSLGYNSERFFAGINGSVSWAEFNEYDASNVKLNDRYNYEIFAGYRFNPPGFLSRTAKNLEDKIPLHPEEKSRKTK